MKIVKVLSYVRRLFELLTGATPLLEAFREALPLGHSAAAKIDRIHDLLERAAANYAWVGELRQEIDQALAGPDIAPHLRELLVKIRGALTAIPSP
jgi:hypothetical protein